MLDAVAVSVRLLSEDGTCHWGNRVAREAAGSRVTSSSSPGRAWLEAVHPDDQRRVLATLREVAADGRPRTLDYRLASPPPTAGGGRRVERITRLSIDAGGGLLATAVDPPPPRAPRDGPQTAQQSSDDATGRRPAAGTRRAVDDALDLAEQRLRLAMAAAPLTLFHCDRDLRLTWISRPLRGVAPDALLGRTAVEIYGQQGRGFETLQREVIRTGARTYGEVTLGIGVGEGLRRSWECWCEPQRDESGEVVGVMVVALENSERKAAEEALRRSEERFRGTFENAGVGVANVGRDGRILQINRRFGELLGYSTDALLARRLVDLVQPEETPSLQRLEGASPDEVQGRHRFQRRDGAIVWLLLSVSESGDGVDEPHSIVVAQDVTAQVAADEQLKELTSTLEQKVARRTSRLERQAEILRRLAAELTTTEQRERKHLAEMLHDHLQQFLVAARLKVGLARRKADEAVKELLVDADAMLGEAVKSARTLTAELRPPVLYEDGLIPALRWLVGRVREQHGLEVSLHAEPEAEPQEEHTRALLYGAVQELLLNVVKHAGELAAEVEVVRAEGGLRVSVIDRGQGFDVRTLEWDRPPSGFGMVSVRERLTALNGKMQVHSSPGAGTRIDLFVPLHEGAPALVDERLEVQAPQERVYVPSEGVRVLLADDHKIVREALATMLEENATIEVIAQASDGQEAVELTGALQPDVVIMDVNMPRMNGIEATRVIKQRWPHVNVVGLSVQDEAGTAASMREAGASAYLYKGGDPAKLIQTVVRSSRMDTDQD